MAKPPALDTLSILQIERSEVRVQEFLRGFEREIGRILRKLIAGKKLQDLSARDVAETIGQITSQLEALGLQKQMAEVGSLHIKEISGIREYFKALKVGEVMTGADAEFVKTLIGYDQIAFKSKVFAEVDGLKSAVMRSVISGNYAAIDDLVDLKVGQTTRMAETELRTALSGFSQTVINAKAEEAGLEYYIYVGPDDNITRDYCAERLEANKIWTIEEILNTDNGQGLDPFVYGGGYNCRHQWRPITAEFAAELGYEVP
jgi:hypothetical protein